MGIIYNRIDLQSHRLMQKEPKPFGYNVKHCIGLKEKGFLAFLFCFFVLLIMKVKFDLLKKTAVKVPKIKGVGAKSSALSSPGIKENISQYKAKYCNNLIDHY